MPGQISVGDRIRITAAVTSFSVHYGNAVPAWRRMVEAGDAAPRFDGFLHLGADLAGTGPSRARPRSCVRKDARAFSKFPHYQLGIITSNSGRRLRRVPRRVV
jgi:hypothetical protein